MSDQGVDRRSFLVAAGSLVLGRFMLPGGPSSVLAAGDASGIATSTREAERLRNLLIPPRWNKNRTLMMWVEAVEDDSSGVMVWKIESEEELAEATRFYEAATWRSWHTEDELEESLLGKGPWLIRYNAWSNFQFVVSDDESRLFGPDEDKSFLSPEPDRGAQVTSARALELIPRLMKHWNLEDTPCYLEPVRPDRAMQDRRSEIAAR